VTVTDGFLSRDSRELAGVKFTCSMCGKDHSIPRWEVLIGSGVVCEIPDAAERALGRRPQRATIVYDRNIEELVGEKVIVPLEAAGLILSRLCLGEPGRLLMPEVRAALEGAARVDPESDILISAGSGVISDLTKSIATKLDRPYILCGTALSMNAYASITAAMMEDGVRLTEYARVPEAIVLATDLLVGAPRAMTHAGVGDLAARVICNADWKLSSLLRGTHFCDLPYRMMIESEKEYLAAAGRSGFGAPGTVEALAEATIMSGYSTTIIGGQTSPSSGVEHLISHYWDMLHHLRGRDKSLHGAQVGIGTLISISLYDYMRRLDPSFIDPLALLASRPSLDEVLAENRARYGGFADAFNSATQRKWIPDDRYLDYLADVLASWDTLWNGVSPYVASLASIRARLREVGAPVTLREINRTREEAVEALLYANRYRSRYTMLDLAWELGAFPTAAAEVLEDSGVA
jgi:glycerol-1-phosphate dehydrogenase [NAD(P)+]